MKTHKGLYNNENTQYNTIKIKKDETHTTQCIQLLLVCCPHLLRCVILLVLLNLLRVDF